MLVLALRSQACLLLAILLASAATPAQITNNLMESEPFLPLEPELGQRLRGHHAERGPLVDAGDFPRLGRVIDVKLTTSAFAVVRLGNKEFRCSSARELDKILVSCYAATTPSS